MTTFVDAFALGIGLDPSKFKKGMGEVTAATKKAREASEKDGKGIEKSMDGAAEAVDKLARNALKLIAIFTAGKAVKDFVADITSADAALGRLAKSIGTTPQVISSLGNAIARNGGSASAAAGSFERLSDSINEIKTTGNSSILPYLYRLQGMGGKTINLNKDLAASFGDIAENAKNVADKQGISFATYLLKQAGIDRDTAALFVQGREAVEKAIEKSRKVGIVSEKDTKAAQALETSIETLRQTSEGLGRTIVTAVSPAITKVVNWIQQWIEKNKALFDSKIAEYVERISKWIDSVNWTKFGDGLSSVGTAALKLAESFGGILTVCGALFAFWTGSKAIAIVSSILRVAGLLGGGPLGWAIRLAMAGAALGAVTADQMPKVLEKEGAAGLDPATGGATERSTMDLQGHEGGGRRLLRRGWNAVKRAFGGGSADAAGGSDGGGGVRRRAQIAPYKGKAQAGGWWTGERQQHAVDTLVKGGVSELGARALVARWAGVEAGGGPGSVNPSSGAFGIAQWLGSRKAGIAGNTDFDAQLQHALKELHGPEKRALQQLNRAKTDEEAATGASMFERAEGYNPSSGVDNFTGKTARVMKGLKVRGAEGEQAAPSSASSGSGRKPDILSDPNDERRKREKVSIDDYLDDIAKKPEYKAEGERIDKAAKELRDGIKNGYPEGSVIPKTSDGRGDNDFDFGQTNSQLYGQSRRNSVDKSVFGGKTYEQYLEDGVGGRTPARSEFTPAHELTLDEIRKIGAEGRAKREREKAAAGERASLSPTQTGAMGAIAAARSAQASQAGSTTNNNGNTSSSETHIGQITVNSAAQDASGIARDIGPAMKRHAFAAASNYARA